MYLKKEFWVKAFLVLLVLSLNQSIVVVFPELPQLFHADLQVLMSKLLKYILFGVFTFLFTYTCYQLYNRKESHLYGLQMKNFDARPYWMMLLIMIPLIVSASFTKGFLNQYPMYKSSAAHTYWGVPEWIVTAMYELVYGSGFVSVEYVFRGFMVIGMLHVLGRAAILPMAAVYCYLHFGKPAGEAISSIFGGYLLGVVAYETRSVWGGVIVHLGIAWGMELAAYAQKLRIDG